MGQVIKFDATKKRNPRPTVDARIEYMYAPDIDDEHPYAIRVVCENPSAGVWLSKSEYLLMLAELVDMLSEEIV